MKKLLNQLTDFFKYRRGIAITALVLTILLSVFLGTNLSLLSKKAEAVRLFESDISLTLKKCAVSAEDLCDIANACGVSCDKLQSAVDTVSHADNTPTLSAYDTEDLFRYVLAVYKNLVASDTMTDVQAKNALAALCSVGEGLDLLADCTAYAEKAAIYNEAISYPLAKVLGVPKHQPVVTFDTIAATYQESYAEMLQQAADANVINGSIHDFLEPIIGGFTFDGAQVSSSVWSALQFVGGTALVGMVPVLLITVFVTFVVLYAIFHAMLSVARAGRDVGRAAKREFTGHNPYRDGNHRSGGPGAQGQSNKNPYSSHVNSAKNGPVNFGPDAHNPKGPHDKRPHR